MTERNSSSGRHRPKHLAALTRGQRILMRILLVLAVVFAVVAVLCAVYASVVRPPQIPVTPVTPAVSTPDVSADPQAPVDDDPAQQPAQQQPTPVERRSDEVFTVLLVGRDTAGGGNTDTMILACFDTASGKLNAMSLPRDTMVNVSWQTKKLNTVFNYYKGRDKKTQTEKGIAALNMHVGKLTGIIPDFYIVVEWDAVGALVDVLGGVTFNVPYDMNYDDPEQDLHIHQTMGERRLTGDDAMQVVRWRKNNSADGGFQVGDSGRMEIQQHFLVAVAKECLKLKNIANIPKFAEIFVEKVDTNLTVGNLIWLARQATGMDPETDIRFTTMPFRYYSRGTSYVLPNVEEMLSVINDGLNPYEYKITAGDLEVLLLQKDGSLKLTSGVLADSALAKPPVKETAAPAAAESAPAPAEQPQTGTP